MKRFIAIGFAALLFSSSASAQVLGGLNLGGENGVLHELLGENGVVPSLLVALTTLDTGPLIDSAVGPEGLVEGAAGVALNNTLTGILDPLLLADLELTIDGVELLLTGLVNGLAGALLGSDAGLGGDLLGGIPVLGGLLGGDGGLPLIGDLLGGGLLGGEGGIPIIGGLLGGEGGIPIIGGLLGGEGGIPIIGGLLGGEGGIPIIGGLLGGDGGLLLIGDLLGGNLLGGGIPIIGGLLGGGVVSGGGQGLALDALPLPAEALDPATLTALVNGVSLPGL